MTRHFNFGMAERLLVSYSYILSSLSVFGLVDNRSAVACVLRSPADLSSVLPPCSGLAALNPPQTSFILTTPSPCCPHFSYFHCLLFIPTLIPSFLPHPWPVHKTTNSIYLNSTHIFDLINLVILNK